MVAFFLLVVSFYFISSEPTGPDRGAWLVLTKNGKQRVWWYFTKLIASGSLTNTTTSIIDGSSSDDGMSSDDHLDGCNGDTQRSAKNKKADVIFL